MRTFKRTLVAGAVALAVSTPAAAQLGFSNMYFFGDSSTDAGFYNGARFTVNPGLVWSQQLGAAYGLTITSVAQGGTDFAQGGTNINSPSLLVPAGAPDRPLSTQVTELLKISPTLDPNALYGIGAGYNDILNGLTQVGAGLITPAQLQANVSAAAAQLVQQAGRLSAAGARYIVVLNVYDLGKSPRGVASPDVPYSSLVGLFNTSLMSALSQAPFQVIRVNTNQLFSEMLANPSFFGFTNVSAPACTVSTPACTTATLVAPNAAQTYLFADTIHPTPAAYVVVGQVANSMLTGPQQVGTLADAPFRVEDAAYRALDGRMWSNLNAPRSSSKLEAWAAYDYGSIDMNAGPSNGTGHENTVAVGGDMKVNARTLAGLMFTYTENKGDFGGAGGGFKLRQPVFTGYVGFGDGPWYVGATAGAGSLDYGNIDRNIVIGPSTRTETGETRGYEYTGRLLGGYWFKYQDFLHGPYASMTYSKAIVRQYSESGSSSTALTFGQQDNEQLLWSVGWQASGSFSGIRPWARVTWQYDSLDKSRDVTAASATLGGWYSVPAPKPDNNYALFNLGAASDFGGVTGYVSGSATAGRGDGNYWAVTVGLRTPL
jgi:outer membrane lipase/esterase